MRLSSLSVPLSPHITFFFSYFPTSPRFRLLLSWRITPYCEFSRLSPISSVNLALSGHLFLPRSSSSFPFLVADQPPRHARPSRSEPRWRVSRFKLTCNVRESERENDGGGERTRKKSEREREANARVRDSRMTSATPRLHLTTTVVADIVKSRWRSGLQTMMMTTRVLPLSAWYL